MSGIVIDSCVVIDQRNIASLFPNIAHTPGFVRRNPLHYRPYLAMHKLIQILLLMKLTFPCKTHPNRVHATQPTIPQLIQISPTHCALLCTTHLNIAHILDPVVRKSFQYRPHILTCHAQLPPISLTHPPPARRDSPERMIEVGLCRIVFSF